MRRNFPILLILLFFCCAAAYASVGPDCSRRLTLGLHDHGLLYSAETDTGIDQDFTNELIRRSGCDITVNVMPRARIWQLIESGALDFSLSGISTPAREKFASFAWYFSNKYYLLVRKDAGVARLADFANNPQLTLGAVRSFQYSKNANQLVARLRAENRIGFAGRLEPVYQVLAKNRIQGMIIEPFDYPQLEQDSLRAITHIVDTGDPATLHGLIMSKKSLSRQEQQKWRELVQAMRADGTVQRIFEKYFGPEQARAMVNF
jgi:polar amino acid transport system substrate-binding protein